MRRLPSVDGQGTPKNFPSGHYLTTSRLKNACVQRISESENGRCRKHFANSRSAFTLLVQTAAFLQLSLTLVAIASRICSLLGDAQVAIETCQTACFRTLQILDVSTVDICGPPQGWLTLHVSPKKPKR